MIRKGPPFSVNVTKTLWTFWPVYCHCAHWGVGWGGGLTNDYFHLKYSYFLLEITRENENDVRLVTSCGSPGIHSAL